MKLDSYDTQLIADTLQRRFTEEQLVASGWMDVSLSAPELRKQLGELDLQFFCQFYLRNHFTKPVAAMHKGFTKTVEEMLETPGRQNLAIAWPRGHGKCDVAETLVLMSDGTEVEVQYILPGDRVMCLDYESMKLVPTSVVAVYDQGVKEVWWLRTRSGRRIATTGEHGFTVLEKGLPKRRNLQNLTVQDRVAAVRSWTPEAVLKPDHSVDPKLLGWMISEGGFSGGGVTFTQVDSDSVTDFRKAAESRGWGVRRIGKREDGITYYCSGARDWARRYGLYGSNSYTKRIPGEVFGWPIEDVETFLIALWKGDGHITTRGSGTCHEYCSMSEGLVRDVQRLLGRFGVVSQVYETPTEGRFGRAWRVIVNQTSEEFAQLMNIEVLGTDGRGAKLDCVPYGWHKLMNTRQGAFKKKHGFHVVPDRRDSSRTRVAKVAALDKSDKLQTLVDSDVFWDSVVSIEYEGEVHTYDIEVEHPDHNYVAEGFVVHNTSWAVLGLPAWCVCYEKRHFIPIISDSFPQAKGHLATLKYEFENNERIAEDFGDLRGNKWQEDDIETTTYVKVVALGSRMKIRGRKFRQWRPDLIIVDDPEDVKGVQSSTMRRDIQNWFNRSVVRAGWENTKILVIGNFIHSECLVRKCVLNPMFQHTTYRAVARWADNPELWNEWRKILTSIENPNKEKDAYAFYLERKVEMDAGAVSAWPEAYPYYQLMVMKASEGSASFSMELQNIPVAPEDRLFPRWAEYSREWIGDEVVLTPHFEHLPVKLSDCKLFAFTDPSLGKTQAADYSAIIIIARAPSGLGFVIEADMKRRTPDTLLQDQIRWGRRYRVARWGIEAVQFQAFFASQSAKESREQGAYLPVVPIQQSHRGGKEMRIQSLQPDIENDYLAFPDRATGSFDLLYEEMEQAPLLPHDDGLDALEGCWRLAQQWEALATTEVTIADTFQFGAEQAPVAGSSGDWVRMELLAQQRERDEIPEEQLVGEFSGLDTSRPLSREELEEILWNPMAAL